MATVTVTETGRIQIVLEVMERESFLSALQNSRKDVAALIWEQHREEILKDTAFVQKIAQEVAEQFWMERKTHIMSDLDLKGLANLIAVYAAKEFKA